MVEIKMDDKIYYQCPECESEIELSDNFCAYCGEQIEWKEAEN